MKLARDLRRAGIMYRKRFALFKYNIQMKRGMGGYQPTKEVAMIEASKRSLNLFDFSNQSDFFLIDEYSDSSEFGGESQCNLRQIKNDNGEIVLQLNGKLVKERNNLLSIDHMFIGFKSLSLFLSNFTYINGLRITMKPPQHPCKLGLYIGTNLNEYEHYVGHLLDIKNTKQDTFQSYELPLNLLMNDRIQSKIVFAEVQDEFKACGITMTIESTHETKTEELNVEISRIDAIFNPEFEEIANVYKHPVFFKSLPAGIKYEDQGFVDNGRTIFNIGAAIDQKTQRGSINNLAYEQQQKNNGNKSIKDRVQ